MKASRHYRLRNLGNVKREGEVLRADLKWRLRFI